MPTASFKGIDATAIRTAALGQPIGAQKQYHAQQVATLLGSNPIFEIRDTVSPFTVYYRTTLPTGYPSVSAAGLALPNTMTEPPSVRVANELTGTNIVMALRNATNSGIEITVPLRAGGALGTNLMASKALGASDLVRLSSVFLRPPAGLDVGGGGGATDWLQIALTDMRKDPSTGSYSYMDSYAINEAKPLHRTESSYSSQYDRAQLTMGPYPNPSAFTTTNPDYQTELSYVDPDDEARSVSSWNRIIPWAQITLSESYVNTTSKHADGYTGNTAVLMWDVQLWVKKNNIWTRLQKVNPTSGEAWRPNFREGPSSSNFLKYENWNGTGLTAFRPSPILGLDSYNRYWLSHPYGSLQSWDTSNVQEVLSSWRTALVMVNTSGTDDRDYARYLAAVGADYYAPNSSGGAGAYLYGMGTSRSRYVTAKYPAFQYHVAHTDTWAGLQSSHPDVSNF